MSTTTDVAHLRDFRPDQDNARLHDERNLAAIETSMQTTGFGRPILAAKDGTVLAGNATLEAAGNIGMEEVILVHSDGTKPIIHVRTDLDPNSEMARLAAFYDNRSSELASWDTEVLAALMQEADIAPVAMTQEEAADLIAAGEPEPVVGNTDPDEVPEPPVEPTTRPGDLWRLGEHRLLCGDAKSEDDITRLMNGERPAMVLTDPPYGMNLDASYRNSLDNPEKSIKASKGYTQVIGDDTDFDPTFLLNYFRAVPEQFWWGADYYRASLPAGGSWLVWDKRDGMEVDWTAAEFELCWSKQSHHRKVLRHRWFGLIGTEQEDQKKRLHPTQKPIGLMSSVLEAWSSPGGLVLDPFLGSGTTLIAAEQLGRRCYGMEIDPVYADVIVRRWEAFTGGTAELERAP